MKKESVPAFVWIKVTVHLQLVQWETSVLFTVTKLQVLTFTGSFLNYSKEIGIYIPYLLFYVGRVAQSV